MTAALDARVIQTANKKWLKGDGDEVLLPANGSFEVHHPFFIISLDWREGRGLMVRVDSYSSSCLGLHTIHRSFMWIDSQNNMIVNNHFF